MFKRSFKVISPIHKNDGGTYWFRCGTAYVNKDNSINVYLEAMPLIPDKNGRGVTIQLRELSETELRERAEKRAAYAARGTLSHESAGSLAGSLGPLAPLAAGNPMASADGVPF